MSSPLDSGVPVTYMLPGSCNTGGHHSLDFSMKPKQNPEIHTSRPSSRTSGLGDQLGCADAADSIETITAFML